MTCRIATILFLTLASLGAGERGYTITTVAGAGFTGDYGPAYAAELGSPEGLAYDRSGNLYVADAVDHRVRRISPEGVITTVAGDGRPGAQLSSPYGLACDAAGNLYIADLGNARIRKLTPEGIIETVAVTVALVQPRNVAVDAAGNLYVSDFGAHKVYRISPGGAMVRVAGTGAPGALDDNLSVEATLAPLNSPAGLAFGIDGALYIADSGNHRVRKVAGGRMTTVAASAGLNTPTGVAVDAAGNLYVAAKGSSSVFRLTTAAVRVAGTGAPGVSGDGGLAVSARLTAPREIVFDAANRLVIADAWSGLRYSIGALRRVADGRISTLAGGASFRSPRDEGPAVLGYLEAPSGLALSPGGALYIADRGDHRVRQVLDGTITTVAGIGFAGSGGDDGLAIRAQVDQPEAVGAGALGELLIAESGRLRLVAPDGLIQTVAAEGVHASGVTMEPDGGALVADGLHHRVWRIAANGAPAVVAGAGEPGYAGDGGPAAEALLDTPTGVCRDSEGNVYIADSANGAIRKVTPDGVIATVALGQWTPARLAVDERGTLYVADSVHHRVWKVASGAAPVVIAGTGVPGKAADGARALQAELNDPADVAVDAKGGLFIAERGNGLVRWLAPDPADPIEIHSVVNAASLAPGPAAPGEILTLYGAGFVPGSTHVRFNGKAAEPLYVDAKQINVRAPETLPEAGSVALEIQTADASGSAELTAAPSSPGLFTLDGVQALVLDENGALNSTANPAAPGGAVTLFATGEGVLQPLSLAICELPAALLRIESAEGVLRVAARIPAQCPAGAQPVTLVAGGASSQPGAVLTIR